jgi:hypothetical protein
MTKERSTSLVLEVGDVEDGKKPQNVACVECEHVWVGLYLPQPISVAAKIMKNLTCPKCGAGSNKIRMHQ